jgi:hypothetical protein
VVQVRLPSPVTFLFWRAAFDLGRVPGPIAIAVAGDEIVVAGDACGESIVLRTRGGRWVRCGAIGAHGLRSVLAAGELVLASGEYGALARSTDGGATFAMAPRFTQGCLYGLSRDRAGAIWLGGDDGVYRSSDEGATWARRGRGRRRRPGARSAWCPTATPAAR